MKKKKLKLLSLIFVFFFAFFLQTVVYSAINSTMKISGNSYARSDADVRITDFNLATSNNATTSFFDFGKTHVVTEVDLIDSSSTITYYLEITNYGSNDVGIYQITGLPSGVNYSISNYNLHDKLCDDSGKCNNYAVKTLEITLSTSGTYAGNVQMNFEFRIFHNVTYTDINNLGYPKYVIDGGNLNVTFNENLKRVLVYMEGVEFEYYKNISNGQTIAINNIKSDVEFKLKEYVAKLKNGSLTKIGSEVCIKDECFHIMENDGTTVKMISKYNLYVGGTLDEKGSSFTPYGDEVTGLQDPNMRGYYETNKVRHGVIQFSSTSYWSSSTSSYPAYVFNSNSNMYSHLDNYKNYLIRAGVEINELKLADNSELNKLGCTAGSKCTNTEYSFIYYTTYWTGDASDSTHMYRIVSDGRYNSLSATGKSGLRPVVVLPVDEIEPIVSVKSGNYDSVGSEICVKDECFYVVSSDSNTVTMLSKYNLHVGNRYDKTNLAIALTNPTGIQDKTAIGWHKDYNENNPIIGSISFSSSAYWSSTVSSYPASVYNQSSLTYSHIENYIDYIESFGISVNDGRLITVEELESLGCVMADKKCTSAPEWVYSTSYWTGSAYNNAYIWNIDRAGFLDTDGFFSNANMFGIRPVIKISKSYID